MPDNQKETQKYLNYIKKLSTLIVDNLMSVEKLTKYAITKPELNPFYFDNYKNWIEKNFNAEMGWMANNFDVRKNLLTRFPWAKSVIVVADNYYFGKERKENTLKISRYAWGDDYHKVLEKKLKRILEELKKYNKEIDGRVYVDTGPILEKAYAVEAGLGWMGKNSLVIVPEMGSFVFLGLLILNVNIDFSPRKIEAKCGNCTNCIACCPTGALEEPYILNSKKCISYFSIEKKGEFTDAESEWLQDWLYGCDICMENCPWNKKWAKSTTELSYYNRLDLLERSPKEWMDLTETEFGILFKKNVFKRLKFERFRRNLLTNIKNLQ